MKIGLLVNWVILGLFSGSVNALVILQYHHISDSTPPSTSTTPQLFKQHLDYLSVNDFKVLALDRVIELMKQGKTLPDKAVVITFDDGYRSIYDTAFPLLKQKKFAFTVFVNTQPMTHELAQFMSWRELKELTQHGGSIANHSVSHPHLIRKIGNETEQQWLQRVRAEVVDAQSVLESNLGVLTKAFAYPYGEYNAALKALLKQLNFVAFGQHSGAASSDYDLQAIPRYPLGGNYAGMEDFSIKINSLPLPIKTVELLDENSRELNDHQLITPVKRPKLVITLQAGFENLEVNCYLSSQGKISKTLQNNRLIFQSNQSLSVGRSRYNCTAPSKHPGRFYWFSQPFIKAFDDGSWYEE